MKMIAPIIITVLLCLSSFIMIGIFLLIPEFPWILKMGLIGIELIFVAVYIYVCIERYEEIRSGEEDDLSKY